jgi:hypothetical protein
VLWSVRFSPLKGGGAGWMGVEVFCVINLIETFGLAAPVVAGARRHCQNFCRDIGLGFSVSA